MKRIIPLIFAASILMVSCGNGTDEARIMKPGEDIVKLDRENLDDDTFDAAADEAGVSSKFVHCQVGKEFEGMKYYLEYIDNDDLYITFDNSENKRGRSLEFLVYDTTFPNSEGEDWHIDRVNYFIDAGKTVTMQYPLDGQIKEEQPVKFGMSIFDKGLNYKNGRADTSKKSAEVNLSIDYYGKDNTICYRDSENNLVKVNLPDGFCGIGK